MSFLAKLASGLRGPKAPAASTEYRINGVKVKCIHCSHHHFEDGSAQLDAAGMVRPNSDWANKSAWLLSCKKCSHIMWFSDQPKKLF